MRPFLLPSAIGLGFLFPQAVVLSGLVPWLLAVMLVLSFAGKLRASWREAAQVLLRVTPLWMAMGPLLALFLLWAFPHWPEFAWAGFLVAIAPTATAAPAVVRLRGGDPSIALAGVLSQSLAVGFLLPLWIGVFSMAGFVPPLAQDGWLLSWRVVISVLPLVLMPLLAVRCIQRYAPQIAEKIALGQPYSLWLWALAVFLVVAKARSDLSLLAFTAGEGGRILGIALLSLGLCLVQFWLGRRLAKGYVEESSQLLGQKNTILMIWVAHSWFGPWAALGPLFYVLWQNLYIAWQTRDS